MPDFLAGQTLTPLHFTPTVEDVQADLFSFDATVFGVDADSGTYNDCAVVFMAPFTGRVKIDLAADLDNSISTASTNVAPVVRTGSVIGSGSTVLAALADNQVRNVGTDNRRYGTSVLLSGLTPGDLYNCRLEHRVSGNTGTVQQRQLIVSPAT